MADYINNKEFEKLIQAYVKGDKSVEDKLFTNIGLLIDKLMNGYNFQIDREDAKQECFLLILRVLKNFDKNCGKGFNFLTTCVLNNCRLLYTKQKKYNKKIENYIDYKTSGNKPLPDDSDS